MANTSIDYCPACFAKNGELHAPSCEYPYNYVPAISTCGSGVTSVSRIDDDYAPLYPNPKSLPSCGYVVAEHVFSTRIAGRLVTLRLQLQEDATPLELFYLWCLMHGRVTGNKMAYLHDKRLARHYVEEPDIHQKQEDLKQQLMTKMAQLRYENELKAVISPENYKT